MIPTKLWINNNDIKALSQDLKNQEVELEIKDRKAKGETIMNILTSI